MTPNILFRRPLLTALCLFLSATGSLHAQKRPVEQLSIEAEVDIRLYYRIGERVVDPAYRDNRQQLARLAALIKTATNDLRYTVDRVTFRSAASPDGDENSNIVLSHLRATSLKQWIAAKTGIQRINIECVNQGENWAELRQMIEESGMPMREEVLKIIDAYPDDRDTRKHKLMFFANSEPWRWMYANLFTELRSLVYLRMILKPAPAIPTAGVSIPVDSVSTASRLALLPQVQPREQVHPVVPVVSAATIATAAAPPVAPVMSIKTNMLYYMTLLPNVEMEFYMGKRWSIGIDYNCAWWEKVSDDRCYQLMMANLELRHWFKGNRQFYGHFLGLYGGGGYYDLKLGEQGIQGESLIVGGLAYGYQVRVGRRTAIELEFGVGYMNTHYRTYINNGTHYVRQSTEQMTWIGPTKLKVSFVWRLGQKGGRR